MTGVCRQSSHFWSDGGVKRNKSEMLNHGYLYPRQQSDCDLCDCVLNVKPGVPNGKITFASPKRREKNGKGEILGERG